VPLLAEQFDVVAPATAAPLIRGTTEEFDGFFAGLFASLYGPLPAVEQDRLPALGRPDQRSSTRTCSAPSGSSPG